jgi:hypothetical protein
MEAIGSLFRNSLFRAAGRRSLSGSSSLRSRNSATELLMTSKNAPPFLVLCSRERDTTLFDHAISALERECLAILMPRSLHCNLDRNLDWKKTYDESYTTE